MAFNANLSEVGPSAVAEPSSILDTLLGEAVYLLLGYAILRLLIEMGLMNGFVGAKGSVALHKVSGCGRSLRAKEADLAEPSNPKACAAQAQLRGAKGPVEACQGLLEMRRVGAEVPPQRCIELFRSAARGGPQVLQSVAGLGATLLSAEGVAAALRDCNSHHKDLAGVAALDRAARDSGVAYSATIYEMLLKLYVRAKDGRAVVIFDDMHAAGFTMTFHQLTHLLARCADSQNLALTQRLHEHFRQQSMANLILYKTLTKVYACCGRCDLACDVYDEVLKDGLEPDAQMYGCLVKFAVQCGRSDLSKALFEKSGNRDKGSVMWLIRSAGREGNVKGALKLLRELQAEGNDEEFWPACEYTLEALVHNGAMTEAEELTAEMLAAGRMNLVAYRALIKGYCNNGRLARARHVITELEAAGLMPDSICFNCIISAAVSRNDLSSAWRFVDDMSLKGLSANNYTVSILLKAARLDKSQRTDSRSPASRALVLLDTVMTGITEDEVLFNTALDACTLRKDYRRLACLLRALDNSTLAPSVHTYGLLIKACSTLGRNSRCWTLWNDMVHERALVPNELALSCMLNFLANCGQGEEALQLWTEYKVHVTGNTIIYSTLMKGFANAGNVEATVAIWEEMKVLGLEMNVVTYTILLGVYARAERMDEALGILDLMEKENCPPNAITYSALARGFCGAGDLQKARKMINGMQAKGLPPGASLFTTLLGRCVELGDFRTADAVIIDIANSGGQVTSCNLALIVEMWDKRKNLEAAFAAVQAAFEDRSPSLDARVGMSLLTACINHGAYDRAVKALQDMKQWPGHTGTSEACYGVLISGLAGAGRERCLQAARIAEEAMTRGRANKKDPGSIFPDACAVLLRELTQHQCLSEAKHLKEQLSKQRRHVAKEAGPGSVVSDSHSQE